MDKQDTNEQLTSNDKANRANSHEAPEPAAANPPAKEHKEIRIPNLFWALVPIFTMVGLMLYVFGIVADTDRYDAAHMPLLCSTVVAVAVGMAYGLSPCAPLLMVLGYAAALTVPAALMLGTVFALASSLIPALLILVLAGTLSTIITVQLGRALPWFQLAVYTFYLATAIRGLII